MEESDIKIFMDALYRFIDNEIKKYDDITYVKDAIKIVDARNNIFRNIGTTTADESSDIYALVDLCILDESMNYIPNKERIRRIACYMFY